MEANNIVRRVPRSGWATLIAAAPKARGRFRTCGDYNMTISQVLKNDYKSPLLPEDLYSMLADGEAFCVLDLSLAYQQLLLRVK